MFHTHTVSGIVISFALFIIFYAGAIALFRDELAQWENPEYRLEHVDAKDINYDKVYDAAIKKIPDIDLSERIIIQPPNSHRPVLAVSGKRKVFEEIKNFTSYIDPTTYEVQVLDRSKTTMANTIYQVHYFRQIPVIGRYLSGLVGLFLVFAVFTGVLTHWKNIVQKFYGLTIKGKWKQIWTNSHISLGFLTIPIQLIYGITGGLLCLNAFLLGPSAFLLFKGDTNEIIKLVSPSAVIKYDKEAIKIDGTGNFNDAFTDVITKYPNTEVRNILANNFGKEDGTITINVNDHKTLKGTNGYVYSYKDGHLMYGGDSQERTYVEATYTTLRKLHYVTYGGIFLKIIYFILAMIVCYIILSGVMIWQIARDNKKYTDKQRKFHHWVTKSYLAVTLSMFPAVGIIFLANKLIPLSVENRISYVNTTFFTGWLVLIILGLFLGNFHKINRSYLFLGSLFGLMIPLVNGIVTGDWLWKTLINNQYYVFGVDLTWLFISISGFIIYKFLKNK